MARSRSKEPPMKGLPPTAASAPLPRFLLPTFLLTLACCVYSGGSTQTSLTIVCALLLATLAVGYADLRGFLKASRSLSLAFGLMIACLMGADVRYLDDPLWFALAITMALSVAVAVPGKRAVQYGAALLAFLAQIVFIVGSILSKAESFDSATNVQASITAMLHGRNPYALSFPSTPFVVHHWTISVIHVAIPLTYGPSVLLLALPGALAGDVRWAALGWIVVTGVCLVALARRSPTPRTLVAAVVLLSSPLLPLMVQANWAESFLVGSLLMWLALRPASALAGRIFLGLSLAGKPTVWPVVALSALWEGRTRRDLPVALTVVLVILLPFVVWGGGLLFHDVVGLQFDRTLNPPHWNSMNANGLFFFLHLPFISTPLWLATALVFSLPFLLTRPAGRSDLFAIAACVTLASLLTADQAFVNYYYVSVVVFLVAAALDGTDDGPLDLPRGIRPASLLRRHPRGEPHPASPPARGQTG